MKKKQQSGFLLVDIGSASVGAAVVRSEKGEAVLEKVTRQAIGAGTEEVRGALEKQMLTALDTLLKGYAGSYKEVRVVLAAPWHSATIRTVKTKSEKPAAISVRTVEHLLEKYKNEKPPASGNVDVEAAALQIKVNGYPTALLNPVRGSDIAVNIYESETSSQLYKSITEKLQSHLDIGRIAWHTFPLTSSAALRSLTSESSFIFIDVGGEVTELGVMHNDALQFLASIPYGYWTIMRSAGGTSVGDTRSRLALWVKEQLNAEEMASVDELFAKAVTPWLTELENALKEASAVVPIPRTAFIMSDTEPAQWLKKGIEERGTMSLSGAIVTPAMVQRVMRTGEGGVFDVFLALEALFFHISTDEVVGEPEPAKLV